jgi:diguanylate cyclase (GGDEF)-like protein
MSAGEETLGDVARLVRIARAIADAPFAVLVKLAGDQIEMHTRMGVPDGSVVMPAASKLKASQVRVTNPVLRSGAPPEVGLFPRSLPIASSIAVPVVLDGSQRALLVLADNVTRADFERKLVALRDVAELLALALASEDVLVEIPDSTPPPEAKPVARGRSARDSVTGLPLRSIALHEAHRMLERAAALSQDVAAIVVSLDRFRRVNEALGPMAGDLLLRQVAERLRGSVSDTDFVGRRSGDEFVIIIDDLEAGSPLLVADRIQQSLREPFHIQGHELALTATVGIAVYPKDADDATQLLRFADMALTRGKAQGTGKLVVFDRAMHEEIRERTALERDLRDALRDSQLSLHYQSKYKIQGGHVHIGAEALLRWTHPSRGLVSPGRFIPIAEETGLIVPIGTWAMTEVCKQVKRWQERGIDVGRVSVNVSALQFARPDFVGTVTRALRGAGLSASALELELTESIVMNDIDHVAARLGELRKLGVRVSVDDFGTGYSSLAYLSRLPVDVLKIDRSFVRELDADGARGEQAGAVAEAITMLGHSLGLDVIAEGVETRGQLDRLTKLGCDEVQGFLFAKPVPPLELETRLSRPPATSSSSS